MKFKHLATGKVYDDWRYTPNCTIKCMDCEAHDNNDQFCGIYVRKHPEYLPTLGFEAVLEPEDPGYTEPAAEEKWIATYECPFCHCHVNIPTNFCPNCGKKLSK